MDRNSKTRKIVFAAAVFVQLCCFGTVVLADGMPEEPRKRSVQRQVPPPPPEVREAPAPHRVSQTATTEENCEWKARLSPGLSVWFFDEEDTLPGPAAFLDVWRTDMPVNFRVGVEGRHMYLDQESAQFAREWEDKTPRVTYIRIPFAVEYIQPIDKASTLYLGGGPDIVHTANDISDTNVGMHLGARLHYAFNDHWGLAVEGGYMWGDVDGPGEDVEFDGAYVTPQLAYTF